MQNITRPRVLCVDDDEDSREMLTILLRLALIEAKTVGTTAQALSSIQTEHFDLYVPLGKQKPLRRESFPLDERRVSFPPSAADPLAA